MSAALYLGALLASLACMVAVDARYRLVLWRHPRRALVVLAIGVAFFLLWDLAAIASGYYRAGESEAMTGIMLAPELPLEELVFITFLCYFTLVLHQLLLAVLRRRRSR